MPIVPEGYFSPRAALAAALDSVPLPEGREPYLWEVERVGVVTRRFHGMYSVAEVEALLRDMRAVQASVTAQEAAHNASNS